MKPEQKFTASDVGAAVWHNTGEGKDGRPISYRTVSIQRSYKDKTGNWKNTGTFRAQDLPKALMVLGKAYEYIMLKETKQKEIIEDHSSSSSASSSSS